jgi:hypothetical protein
LLRSAFIVSWDSFPIGSIEHMYGFLSKSSYLLSSIADSHAHEEAIRQGKILTCLEFVFVRVELVHASKVLELLRFLIISLTANYENSILVPWEMHSDEMAQMREFLVSLQLNEIPSIAFH